MIIKNVTGTQMEQAMNKTNMTYNNNVQFNRYNVGANKINFTLRVKSSSGKGARRSFNGRKLVACCFHGHYEFMRCIFDIAPNAVISSCKATYKGKEDFKNKFQSVGYDNCGSMMNPLSYGDACDCGK